MVEETQALAAVTAEPPAKPPGGLGALTAAAFRFLAALGAERAQDERRREPDPQVVDGELRYTRRLLNIVYSEAAGAAPELVVVREQPADGRRGWRELLNGRAVGAPSARAVATALSVLKTFDQALSWKGLRDAPERIAVLEARLAALEALVQARRMGEEGGPDAAEAKRSA